MRGRLVPALKQLHSLFNPGQRQRLAFLVRNGVLTSPSEAPIAIED